MDPRIVDNLCREATGLYTWRWGLQAMLDGYRHAVRVAKGVEALG